MRLFLLLGICFVLSAFCQEEEPPAETETPKTADEETTTTTESSTVDETTETSSDEPTTENPFAFDEDEEEEKEINEILAQAPIPEQTPEGAVTVEVVVEPLELDTEEEKELDDDKDDFINFHKKFKRNIKKSKLKEAVKNFKANNRKLRAKRKGKKNFKVGMHPFMHLSAEKINKLFMKRDKIAKRKKPKLPKVGKRKTKGQKARARKQRPKKQGVKKSMRRNERAAVGKKRAPRAATLPKSFDWRKKNVLNGVKDQGDCGSCWTFSATCTVEANYAIKYKKKIDLSEQQLTCVYNESTICEGGFPDEALEYLQTHGGQTTEASFPYSEAHKSTCKKVKPKAKVASVGDLLPFGMAKVKQAIIKNGPIAFGMFVNDDFMNYEAGVFDSECTPKDDGAHAMAIVGYGEEGGVPYWIVRNQWGTDWGEKGHIKIKAGVNLCEIESMFMIQAKVK